MSFSKKAHTVRGNGSSPASEFLPTQDFNLVSLRATASAINKTGVRRLTISTQRTPQDGARITSLDISSGVTDLAGALIDFAPGQRMRKYPFTTMAPGDTFTLPTGATDITALRSILQYHRTRAPALQYQITRNEDGGFTVTC